MAPRNKKKDVEKEKHESDIRFVYFNSAQDLDNRNDHSKR